jgi:hypothetical protein
MSREIARVVTPDEAAVLDTTLRASTIAQAGARWLAYTGRIWEPLGLASWEAYLQHAQLPALDRDERRELVTRGLADGWSKRAIAQAAGVSDMTVARDAAQVQHLVAPEGANVQVNDPQVQQDVAPAQVRGRDGKTYTPPARQPGERPDELLVMGGIPDGANPMVVVARQQWRTRWRVLCRELRGWDFDELATQIWTDIDAQDARRVVDMLQRVLALREEAGPKPSLRSV